MKTRKGASKSEVQKMLDMLLEPDSHMPAPVGGLGGIGGIDWLAMWMDGDC